MARKAENARLLAIEEASTASKPKINPKAGAKKASVAKAPKPAGPGAIAAGGGLGAESVSAAQEKGEEDDDKDQEPGVFAATGIDNALDLLEVVTAKMDKASVGQQAAGIERHPEVRMNLIYPIILVHLPLSFPSFFLLLWAYREDLKLHLRLTRNVNYPMSGLMYVSSLVP